MASLRKKENSPFWFACFTLPSGTRTQRSTGTGDKRLAMSIAMKLDDAAREAAAGRFVETRARKTIADIYKLGNNDNLPSSTIKAYCESWLKRKEHESKERTHQRYKVAVDHFLKYAGGKASRDIAHLTVQEITGLRDNLAEKLSPNSANYTVKVLRAMLNQARRDGFVETNEASRVTLIQRVRQFERRAFSLPELKRILAVANDEWRGMILFGIYTGLRLGDIALLTWANVDLVQEELVLTTQKTGKPQILPLAKPLLRYLRDLPSSDDPEAPVFPKAQECKARNMHGGPLSNQFYQILVSAGMMQPRTHKSKGKGRDSKRQLNEISFHSLRHTATSLLKNAGVSDAIARDIIGHESPAVSQRYTHIESKTKRKALNKLPDVTKG